MTINADSHSTLAISASYVDFLARKAAVSSRTLHHISQAYALVNIKLSGPFSVSDSAIAAVVSLAIYQQVHHQPATGLVHLHGLYRMIELRGGIGRLMQENRPLAMKPLRYVTCLISLPVWHSLLDNLTIPDLILNWQCKMAQKLYFAATRCPLNQSSAPSVADNSPKPHLGSH